MTDQATDRVPPVQKLSRVALIGDVGGHSEAFCELLSGLGCDPDAGTVPDGLVVVQLGDLVHRGPDSVGCLRVADKMLGSGRYVQLLGNHEGHELGGPMMAGFEDQVDAEGVEILVDWWVRRRAHFAALISTADGPVVASHGGVTAWLWRALTNANHPPELLVRRLNAAVGDRSRLIFQAGVMLDGAGPDAVAVGPAWAEAVTEVYLPWSMEPLVPFGQIHGHSGPMNWRRKELWRHVPPIWAESFDVDFDRRHTRIDIGGCPFWGVDPAHGKQPTPWWAPLELEGTVLV